MNLLRDICLSVSFALIGGGMINILSPGGWEKTVRYVTGLFIICCFAVPLAGADFSGFADGFALPSVSVTVGTASEDSYILSLTEEELSNRIYTMLKDKDINPHSIDVVLQKQEEAITGCTVTLWFDGSHMSQRDAAFAEVNEYFGGEAEIIVKEVEENEGTRSA